MDSYRGDRLAFGQPGIEPRWTRGNKDGVGTAYSAASRIWFTLWNGILTEVYYPTVDRPQLRDMQYLISDGESFFHDENRHLVTEMEPLSPLALGYRIINTDKRGRYSITKEVIADPHLSCILQRTHLSGDEDFLSRLHLYVLCAPHLNVGGANNNAYVIEVSGREILIAEKQGTWMALMASIPFCRLSVGYVGRSDGWTDIARNYHLDWEFDQATNGNVALTGEIPLDGQREFTLGLALGESLHSAVTTLFQSLGVPFETQMTRYVEQWSRPWRNIQPLEKVSGDEGRLYRKSYTLLMSHEDKTYPGALIASMSIPWGEAKGDEDMGGYHLVWTRDIVNSATGLLAAGNKETPLRVLIYLAASQQEDGGYPQNFWIDGQPYWSGVQLDEVSFPILLAWRLRRENALQDFDPLTMVLRAAGYIIKHGPATQQERWEEASGYSPSTLAANIAALIAAAHFAEERKELSTALYLKEYADFLEQRLEKWTVTTEGVLHPAISRHYIRIKPVDVDDPFPDEDPNHGMLTIPNLKPGADNHFSAKDIVDAGFLEFVRYGIRRPDDPLIVDSLKVVDSVLKVETPAGPCWHRYNHDGFGQCEDGGPYHGWGKGRAWPLLTGERGHYELAAGGDVNLYLRTINRLASPAGLLPEQVWDEPDRPKIHMYFGKPTGAAMPLMWAHAEYIKLLRSAFDGVVFDYIPEVGDRYRTRSGCKSIEIWKHNRQVTQVVTGSTLRIQATGAFRLHWTADEWQTVQNTDSTSVALGIDYVDVPIRPDQRAPIRFTFLWLTDIRWEGRDYRVNVTLKPHGD